MLAYYVDWGDGTNSGWVGMYNSGEEFKLKHKFTNKGTYIIKAKARDENYDEGDWGTLSVTMPRSITIKDIIYNFLERFPKAFPILRYLLRL